MTTSLRRLLLAAGCLVLVGTLPPRASAQDARARADAHDQDARLRAAAVKVDITPAIGTPLAGYGDRTGGSTGIRDPLRAGILVFDNGETRAAMVTLDLISIGTDETAAIRKAISSEAAVPEDHILVASSHTHGSPRLAAGSDYGRQVAAKVGGAAAAAVSSLRTATIGYGSDEISYCVNRRLLNADGVAEMRPNREGVVDPRVRILRIDAVGSLAGTDGRDDLDRRDSVEAPMAILMHNACHANVFRNENTRVTADFPGVAQEFVERAYRAGTPTLFIQGAAGDTRPNLPTEYGYFRSGTDADVMAVGTELGAAVVAAAARAGIADAVALRDEAYPIRAAVRSVELPGKDDGTVPAEIQALRIGSNLFLTIPGEPFTAYQLQVEDALTRSSQPDAVNVFVAGYSNGSIGYVCTEESYQYGGYEPDVSRLAPEAESILVNELILLGNSVL